MPTPSLCSRVEQIAARCATGAHERGRDARPHSALLSLSINCCPSESARLFVAPLLDQFAQCDREVARRAFEAVGAGFYLVNVVGRTARRDRRERVRDLRVQTLRRRMNLLLRARRRLRGGNRTLCAHENLPCLYVWNSSAPGVAHAFRARLKNNPARALKITD